VKTRVLSERSAQGAFIIAKCHQCHGVFEIQHPTPTTHIRHLGDCSDVNAIKRERLPEKVYERCCEAATMANRDAPGAPS